MIQRRSITRVVLFCVVALSFENLLLGIPPFDPSAQVEMGAELNKPYTEIEFMGMVIPLENLRGGHNGRSAELSSIVAKCRTNPPEFDEETGLWRIPVTNNFIQFEAADSPMGRIRMGALEEECDGYLEVVNPATSSENLDFPVRSVFTFHVKVELLDHGLTLFSEDHVTVASENLDSWPPPVGTVYLQTAEVPLVAEPGGPTLATLRPDTTVITEILRPTEPIPGLSALGLLTMILVLAAAGTITLARKWRKGGPGLEA